MMNRISCAECGVCNRKGKPSVSRFSAYCDSHVKKLKKTNRIGLFNRFRDFLFDKRAKLDESGQIKEFKKNGFRESWFWR